MEADGQQIRCIQHERKRYCLALSNCLPLVPFGFLRATVLFVWSIMNLQHRGLQLMAQMMKEPKRNINLQHLLYFVCIERDPYVFPSRLPMLMRVNFCLSTILQCRLQLSFSIVFNYNCLHIIHILSLRTRTGQCRPSNSCGQASSLGRSRSTLPRVVGVFLPGVFLPGVLLPAEEELTGIPVSGACSWFTSTSYVFRIVFSGGSIRSSILSASPTPVVSTGYGSLALRPAALFS